MWLLSKESAAEVANAKSARAAPTTEQLAAFQAHARADAAVAGDRPNPVLKTAGSVAEISINGVLTQEPDFWLWIFGIANTSYRDIVGAIAQAEQDPSIKSVVYRVNSPGGSTTGYFDCIAAIQASKKPKSVVAECATSAAYGIAACAGKITAVSAASVFGSIGVATSFTFSTLEEIVDLTSTEAPDKRPDVQTAEGQAVVVRYLDALHSLFVDAIAGGRGTKAEAVNADYGRGASLLADDAKKRGMIDAIAMPRVRLVKSASAEAEQQEQTQLRAAGDESQQAGEQVAERKPMDLKALRAAHPELCAELETQSAAHAVTQERDRVGAHLTMGETSGDMKTALAAVREGSAMTQTLMAAYMAAGMNRSDRSARQTESNAAGEAVNGAAAPVAASEGDVGDAAAKIMAERRGKKLVS